MDTSFWNESPHELAPDQIILWFSKAVAGWLGLAPARTGSEFGRSRRAVSVEPRQTGWHSWQSSEAHIEGSEYTRLSCSGRDRSAWLARCHGDCWSCGGEGGPEQGDLASSPSSRRRRVCCACVHVQLHVFLCAQTCFYECSRVSSFCIVEGVLLITVHQVCIH